MIFLNPKFRGHRYKQLHMLKDNHKPRATVGNCITHQIMRQRAHIAWEQIWWMATFRNSGCDGTAKTTLWTTLSHLIYVYRDYVWAYTVYTLWLYEPWCNCCWSMAPICRDVHCTCTLFIRTHNNLSLINTTLCVIHTLCVCLFPCAYDSLSLSALIWTKWILLVVLNCKAPPTHLIVRFHTLFEE